MNWLLIVLAVFVLCMALRGYKYGFVYTLMSFLSCILTIMIVGMLAPTVKDILAEKTGMREMIIEGLTPAVQSILPDAAIELNPGNIPLPEALLTALTEQIQAVLSTEDLALKLSTYFADIVLYAIVYVGLYVVVYGCFRVIISATRVVTRLPGLRGLDQTAGLILSVMEALVVIWIIFLLMTALSQTEIGMRGLSMVSESRILSWMYDINPILQAGLRLLQ